MSEPRNVTIIGSGPAGYTAAIYAARANLSPLCIEGLEHGGQLMLTTDVENYPGFEKGIQGPDLMEVMRKQAQRVGTEFITDNVTRVDFSVRPFKVWVGDQEIASKSVVISTGAAARWMGLESETALRGRGVSTCATCDGFFFKEQPVCIVGGGDSAMEEAIYLANICSKVTVIHRRSELRASKIMQDRAKAHPKIDWIWNSVIEEVHDPDQGTVTGVTVRNVETNETSKVDLSGVFVAIGHTPNTKIFEGQVELDDAGYLLRKNKSETSVPGVFAAGDVSDTVYRQAVTAAGMGCMAAMDAERFLGE